MSKLRLPKKYLVVDYDNLFNVNFPIDEPFNLIVFKDEIKCDFVVHLKGNTDKLLVLGSGLTPRDKVPKMNPYYNRVSWDFKYSTIFYNDPTSYAHDKIYGAWGVGTPDTWYLEVLAEVIKRISDNLYRYTNDNRYSNIMFIGSSQGGFTSFMLSVLVKNSSSISDIPQTDIFEGFDPFNRLPFHIYKESILKYLFNDMDLDELYKKYGYRLNFIELMKRENYIPNAFLCLDCSFDIDFETQYLSFFKKLNELPFSDEFSNTIRIRIDGKNAEHRNMSKEKLMESIDNVFFINSHYDENLIPYKSKIRYNIVENTVKVNGVIRFYGLNNFDFDKLYVSFNNQLLPFTDLEKGFSKRLGVFYDFPASNLGVGIHEICLNYNGYYSNISKIFVKDAYNVLDYNLWSGTEVNSTTENIISGHGQKIESSSEWSHIGDRSLKITKVGESFVWTDIPIKNIYAGNLLRVSGSIETNSKASIFFVFRDVDGNQSFSFSVPVNGKKTKKFYLESVIGDNIKEVSLRFWIKDDINSTMFIDNIKAIVKKENIAIYGSCCTKDPFTSLFNKNYKQGYVALINDQRHSLISTMQEKEDIDVNLLNIVPEYSGSKFITKCLIEDFNKNFLYSLLDNPIDYLVMDVFFEVDIGVLCYDDNKIITNAKGIEHTDFYKLAKNKESLSMLRDPEEFYNMWVKYCDMFFDFLKSNCPNVRVVLAEIRLIDTIIKDDGSTYVDESFKELKGVYNPLIIKLENYIKEHYDVLVIPFDESLMGLENHVWGKHYIHYENRYYTNFLDDFSKVVAFDKLIRK